MLGISLEEIHASSVHVPLVLLTLSVIFDILGYIRRTESFRTMALYSLGIGWLGAVSSVVSGWLVQENGEAIPGADRILYWHRLNGFMILGIFGLSLLLRLWQRERLRGKAALGYLILGVVGMALVLVQGYLGGRMVYDYSVGTTQP